MGVPKRLTELQRKFAEILVFGDKDGKPVTKTEAAKLAGFHTIHGNPLCECYLKIQDKF